MIGENYALRKKTTMKMLIGREIVTHFVLPTKEKVSIKDEVEKHEVGRNQGYFLKRYGIQIPLKSLGPPIRYKPELNVNVNRGSSLEKQLKEKGIIQ